MSLWTKIGKALKNTAGYIGKGISFVGKGIGKGFKVLKKAVVGVGTALGASATLLGLGKKAETEGKESQRRIEEASKEGDRKVEGVKAESQKMVSAPPPRPDSAAEQDRREAKASGTASRQKLDAMEAGLRVMDGLSAHTAEILRRYGSSAAKGMVSGMDARKPVVNSGMSSGILMGEQIRLLYEQKVNHKHGIYSILSMIGANNELLGVLSDQLRLIHAQGVTDANYDVIKSKVMESLATKAVADSIKVNAILDSNDAAMQASLKELVSLQKEGNISQEQGTKPLLKKVGMGMVAGLAGLAGLMLASKYLGKGDEDSAADIKEDSEEDDKGWTWPWEDDEREERDDEEDKKNSDYIKDDGSLMTAEERDRVDELKTEAKLSGGAMAAANAIEGVSAIKKAKGAVSATKAVAETAGKVGAKALTEEARKKFLRNLGPRAMKVIGAKIATKLGIKAATKGALKKVPVLGLGFSLFEAVPRLFKGDYTGAALALGSGAASVLHAADVVTGPGGSIAAIGLGLLADGALAMHDYNKAIEDLKNTGHTDLLEDEDLDDLFVPPTEEEMKAAEEAERKVAQEKKAKLESGLSDEEWGKYHSAVADGAKYVGAPFTQSTQTDAKGSGLPSNAGTGEGDANSPLFGKMKGTPGSGETGAPKGGLLLELAKQIKASLPKPTPRPQGATSMGTPSAGSHEVKHGGSDIWMGDGANGSPSGEGMGDLSECRSYPPETMERITNFEAHPPNEIDEEGPFKSDVQGMITDLTNMQGTIRYSMEQRDIDKGVGDCSTFTKWAMKKYFGIDIGNNCDMQLGENLGKVVDYSGVGINGETSGARGPNISALKPGDLIYYSSSRRPWNAGRPFRIAHVEMYIGNGKVIGQTTTKGKGKGSDPKGPWIHDINDPNLGTFLAAKRYIGQTESSSKYAVDPDSVSAQQAPVKASPQTPSSGHEAKGSHRSGAWSSGMVKSAWDNVVQKYEAYKAMSPTPTQAPATSAPQAGANGNGQGDAQVATSRSDTPVAIDNSTVTKGGDTYITNNNTTNIYTHEDGRGTSELS